MTESLDRLAEHAHDTRVVVVGGGIGGLVAALECAKVGIRVTLLEEFDALGGSIRSDEVAGIRLDLGAESYATRGGHVRALIDELGLAEHVVTPAAGGAWVAGLPRGGAAPLPVGGLLGIPANPFADDVRRVLGWRGAWRAYLDRLRPPLTIGHAASLGRLVRSRLGAKVLDRLVAPVTSGVYSAHPDDIDPDAAAPGLNAALTRAGSLTGAVALLRGERKTAPGSAVEGLAGGMSRLVDALADRLAELGVEVRTSAAVEALEREGGTWRVRLVAEPQISDGVAPDDLTPPAGEEIVADAVIVATGEEAARRMIAPHATGLDARPARPGPVVDVVSLVLDSAELDAAPRGTGVLTVPGSHRAKALTHASAKWAWLADAAGPHRHVVRVSFGSQGEAPATAGLDEQDAASLALEEASALLGVPLGPDRLAGARVASFTQSQPASTTGRAEAASAAREAVHRVAGVGAVGAWLAGTGLAQVVPDAVAEAERVRRELLFS